MEQTVEAIQKALAIDPDYPPALQSPESLERTLRGSDPGFLDVEALDFRLRDGSPLIGSTVMVVPRASFE